MERCSRIMLISIIIIIKLVGIYHSTFIFLPRYTSFQLNADPSNRETNTAKNVDMFKLMKYLYLDETFVLVLL